MKKSIFGKIGAAAVVLTLVTGSLVGGTFAKYTSTVSGTGTAQVAKWAIAMREADKSLSNDFNITLQNENSAAKTQENVIAPGSSGQINLTIDGTDTQVSFTYSIKIDKSKLKNVPIKFYSDKIGGTEVDFGETTEGVIVNADIDANAQNKVIEVPIYWAWVSSSDGDDTLLGITPVTGEIGVTMTAVQSLPSEPSEPAA